jgi:hypothetical protein
MNTNSIGYPVRVTGELSVPPGRWKWLFKWILAIPHYVCLFGLGIAFIAVWMVSFFAILFTGKYPRALFDFNAGVLRWSWRVGFYSYSALGTDQYPPFSLEPDPAYPADLKIEYPEQLSRGLVLVKWWLLAIPHFILVGVFMGTGQGTGLIGILTLIAGIIVLFTGTYPKDLFKLVIGLNRWVLRVAAYAALMRDEYPPFRLWDKE